MSHSSTDVKKDIRQFIAHNLLFTEEADYADDASLLDSGILDSFGVMELVAFVEEEFGVQVEDDEILPANFDSVEAIVAYVESKQEARVQ